MKIVVTDGFTTNPGDLSWEEIAALGGLKIYDRTAAELVIERCVEADIILTNKVAFSKDVIAALPQLKMINVFATGYDTIDTAAAKGKGIAVYNVPGYGTPSVAQHTFALLLELTNHTGVNAASVAAGEWVCSADFSYTKSPVVELSGKTMGIVGFGNIGQQTARIALALGMKIIYSSRHKKETGLGSYVSLPELFSQSDVVSLHCPLKPDNHQFVNNELLKLMKKTSFLINTARGQLINEQHLADALNNEAVAGAALDVLSAEPPRSDNPLLTAKNCIITPHTAWISREARQRIMEISAGNIRAFLKGSFHNKVN